MPFTHRTNAASIAAPTADSASPPPSAASNSCFTTRPPKLCTTKMIGRWREGSRGFEATPPISTRGESSTSCTSRAQSSIVKAAAGASSSFSLVSSSASQPSPL